MCSNAESKLVNAASSCVPSGKRKTEQLSGLSVYHLHQVGRFLSVWRCRVLSGNGWATLLNAQPNGATTIAAVSKQCGFPARVANTGHSCQDRSLPALAGCFFSHVSQMKASTNEGNSVNPPPTTDSALTLLEFPLSTGGT